MSVHYPGIEGECSGPAWGQKISKDGIRLQIRVENADIQGSIDSGSAGQILHLTGSRLRFAWDDEEQGVFFNSASASAGETRIAVYSHIGSNIVEGKIPDLEAGEYGLEIRTRPGGRELRVGQYGKTIAIS